MSRNLAIIGAVIIVVLASYFYNQRTETTLQINIPNKTLRLDSPKFRPNAAIPTIYTCDGEDLSPPLEISGVPNNASSLVLIADDPDAPGGVFIHWLVYNIPPDTTSLAEGKEPVGDPGLNSWNKTGYGAPCPPSGIHHYHFKLYALDTKLILPPQSTKSDVLKAMAGHILDQTDLVGTYKRGGS